MNNYEKLETHLNLQNDFKGLELLNEITKLSKRKATPLKKEEVLVLKEETVPNEVIEVVNKLLVQNKNNANYIKITMEEVVEELMKIGFKRNEVFDKGFLNFENIYRKQGWTVIFDKPSYNETYKAYYTFE